MVPTYQTPIYQPEYNYLPSISPAGSIYEETAPPSSIPLPAEDEDESEVLTGLGLYDEAPEDSAPLKLTEEWTPPPETEEDGSPSEDEEPEDEEEEEESGSPTEVEPRTPEQPPQPLLPSQHANAYATSGKPEFAPGTYAHWWSNQGGPQYISEPQIQGQQHTWQGMI